MDGRQTSTHLQTTPYKIIQSGYKHYPSVMFLSNMTPGFQLAKTCLANFQSQCIDSHLLKLRKISTQKMTFYQTFYRIGMENNVDPNYISSEKQCNSFYSFSCYLIFRQIRLCTSIHQNLKVLIFMDLNLISDYGNKP